jgi:ankyrin repeat protein
MDTARALITAGANTDLRSNNRSTALHHACWSLHADIAQYLIHVGASLEAKTIIGDTPLHEVQAAAPPQQGHSLDVHA